MKLSVCIDVYNYEAFLPEAIESVLRQDFTDFELIVGDDCSTDRSFEIAQSYAKKDSRVVAQRNAKNLGMVKNRNACIRPAKGEYVKILHADDFLITNDALSKMVTMLDASPSLSLVACSMQFVDPSSVKLDCWTAFEDRKLLTGTTVIAKCLRTRRNLVGGPSAVMYRANRGARGFDENYFNSADFEMWLYLLEQGCFSYIQEPLVAYRKHPRQQTEKDKLSLSEYADHLRILDRYLDQPYIRFSKMRKRYLRYRAVRGFVRRSNRLGLPDGAQLLDKYGRAKYLADKPLSALYRLTLIPENSRDQKPASTAKANDEWKHLPAGLNVAGFFKSEYGIGDASRAFYRMVRDSKVPASFINIQSRDHRNMDSSAEEFSQDNPYSINLMTFSADYARRFYRDTGAKFFRDRYNIAVWYWELDKFSSRWHPSFDYYDEIWVNTEFCRKSIAEVSPLPVVKIAYPFHPPKEMPVADRAGFGLEKDAYYFLFDFDFYSVLKRKNPDGLITAFRRAFEGRKERAFLAVKSINSAVFPERAAELRKLVEGLNVVWMDQHLDASRLYSLYASVDCYVSLHRSEGLGLGIARAMTFGKPVIATGYSGNMDFMNPQNSLPVKFKLLELDQDYGVYEKGNFWADPDLDNAAETMRWAFTNREAAEALGRQAKADMQATPAIAKQQMMARLVEIDPRFKSL